MAVIVITYHRFPEFSLAAFRRQCESIARHFRTVSMEEAWKLLAMPDSGEPVCAITVDDGHRDFLDAVPILRHHGIPATLYVVTNFASKRDWLWFDQVTWLCEKTSVATLRVESETGNLDLRFDSEASRKVSTGLILEHMKRQPNTSRLDLLARLPSLFEFELPSEPPPENESISWEELAALRNQSVTLGAHTSTHPILSSLVPGPDLQEEIAGCKREMEERLGQPVHHFAYPNGRRCDMNSAVRSAVAAARFRTAATTIQGVNRHPVDPLMLRRVWMEPWMPIEAFESRLRSICRSHL